VGVEEVEEAGDFEGAAEVGAEIGETEAGALGFDFAMSFDQSAEPGAVYIVDVLEIDDDARGAGGEKIVNGGAKAGAFVAENQTAAEIQKIETVGFVALRDFERHRKFSARQMSDRRGY
jgi:hypothetical protein